MKVVFYISSLGGGGAERVLSILVNNFSQELKYDVNVITYNSKVKDFYILDKKVKRVRLESKIGYNIISKIIYRIQRLILLRRSIKKLNPDIVLPLMEKANIESILATIGLEIPIVPAEHSNYWAVKSKATRILRLITYRLANRVILLTKSDKLIYDNYLDNCEVIPNPITVKGGSIIQNRSKIILCVGRLNPVKQFDHIIYAYSEIIKTHPDWKLIIAGEGDERKNLQEYIERLNLSNFISLIGNVTNIHEYYNTSGIFVLCSEYEGLPMALGEAMLCSMPVVSYDCPTGPSDMIEDNISGLLVNHNDKKELQNKIESLIIDESKRKKLGQEAKIKMHDFSLERVSKQWDNTIKSIVNSKNY